METAVKKPVNNLENAKDVLAKEVFIGDLIGQNSSKSERREGILNFEKVLSEDPDATFVDSKHIELTHRFSDKMYVREIFIEKDTMLTGKIHLHDHPNFLMSGQVLVVTEDGGKEFLEGPLAMISPAGTKRALYAITDVTWVTVHLNPCNTQDLGELEKLVIAKDYEQYEREQKAKGGLIDKVKKFLIKKLIS
jgi:hypothetical protein